MATYTFTPASATIGGRGVVITRCAATEALDLELSLAKVLGGSIEDFGANPIALLIGAAKGLTKAELIRLMNMVFQYTMIDGQKVIDINSSFADRPRDIWEVFILAVTHNLGPLGELLQEKFGLTKLPTPTSPASSLSSATT